MTNSSNTSKPSRKPRLARKDLPPVVDPNLRYSIAEASAYLDQCHAKTFQEISSGRLESFKDGRRRYISGRAIIARCSPPPRPSA